MRLIGVQVDEQVVNLVQHFLRACVRAVDFVNDHDGRQLGLQRFGQHVASLGQRALGGVHKQHDAVHHLQSALHLAAEVGVARRIDIAYRLAHKYGFRSFGFGHSRAIRLGDEDTTNRRTLRQSLFYQPTVTNGCGARNDCDILLDEDRCGAV